MPIGYSVGSIFPSCIEGFDLTLILRILLNDVLFVIGCESNWKGKWKDLGCGGDGYGVFGSKGMEMISLMVFISFQFTRDIDHSSFDEI